MTLFLRSSARAPANAVASLRRFFGVQIVTPPPIANVFPCPKSLLSLNDLRAVFSGVPQFHRFPRAAMFDNDPESWGGISLFVPIGERGRAAWRYAHETLSALQPRPHFHCHATYDPVPLNEQGRFKFVFDRSVGRSSGELRTAGIAQSGDQSSSFLVEDAARITLFHHVLLVASAPMPRADLDQVARCKGWDTCEPIAHGGPTLGECTVNGIFTGPAGCDEHRNCTADGIAASYIVNEQLREVERLLIDGVVYDESAPLEHRVEALFYTFLFSARAPGLC